MYIFKNHAPFLKPYTSLLQYFRYGLRSVRVHGTHMSWKVERQVGRKQKAEQNVTSFIRSFATFVTPTTAWPKGPKELAH